MPVIAVASAKGGVGKSTVALILSTEFAHVGVDVVVLESDPNGSLSMWAEKSMLYNGHLPKRIEFHSNLDAKRCCEMIKKTDKDGTIVVVDLEGIADRTMSQVITQADLVIVPMRTTTLDATIGCRIFALIEEEEKILKRKINYAVAFTMTKGIHSKQHDAIKHSLASQGIDIIEPSLMERVAFSALFEFGGDLYTIPKQGNMVAAATNASQFVQQVYQRLGTEAYVA